MNSKKYEDGNDMFAPLTMNASSHYSRLVPMAPTKKASPKIQPLNATTIEKFDISDVSDIDDDDLFDEIVLSPNVKRSPTIVVDDDDDCVITTHEPLRVNPLIRRNAVQLQELEDEEMERVDGTIVVNNKRQRTSQGPKCKNWCITYNNPTVSDEVMYEMLTRATNVKGFVFQREVGESGTEHLQMYIEFEGQNYYTAVYKVLKTNAVCATKAKGTKAQNVKYCTKVDTRKDGHSSYISGSCTNNAGQGKRTDLDDFAEAILKSNGVNDEVMDQFPGHVLRFNKHAKDLLAERKLKDAKEAERAYWREQVAIRKAGGVMQGQQQRHLELYFGPTGVGKTTEVKAKVLGDEDVDNEMYTKDCTHKWWDGYTGEEHVLMDEFKGDSFCQISAFNDMTNVGTQQVEVKGGVVQMAATKMYFTTNWHPSQWWKRGENYSDWSDPRFQAVARRFKIVYWWNDENVLTVLNNPGLDDGSIDWKIKSKNWIDFWKWKKPNTWLNPATGNYEPVTDDNNSYFTL